MKEETEETERKRKTHRRERKKRQQFERETMRKRLACWRIERQP